MGVIFIINAYNLKSMNRTLLTQLIKECLEEVQSEQTMCNSCAIKSLQELKANPVDSLTVSTPNISTGIFKSRTISLMTANC